LLFNLANYSKWSGLKAISVSLFLIDGIPDGRIACELFNWTGKSYKIPRSLLKESANRGELFKAGVHFLFGRDESSPEVNIVYIGEAEEVYKRIIQHQDKDFWTEVLVFISKDENLNKAHIKFLEFSVHLAAYQANRYNIVNSNTPTCPAISEPERAVMMEFFENLKLLVGTLGYRVFEPLTAPLLKATDEYFITATRGAKAKAVVTTEGIVVTAGSEVADSTVPSISDSFKKLRQKLQDQGVIVHKENKLIFAKDYLFSSPSTAAAVVMGKNANGRIAWKDNVGKTLKDNEEL
jgi:hypothetical protein